MNAAAIICEFNPFHHGHAYILSKLKEMSDCVIAVMSGNYVQRGEAAVFDKYARAQAAIHAGADLVCELPFPWSSASAAYFASAGTWIASNLGAHVLGCGASQIDQNIYFRIATMLNEFDDHETIRSNGIAVDRTKFISDRLGEEYESYLCAPNDILAIEYAHSIQKQLLDLQLYPIRRISAADRPDFQSASEIRRIIFQNGFSSVSDAMPDFAYKIFLSENERKKTVEPYKLADILFHSIRMRSRESADVSFADGDHGVLHRLFRMADESHSSDEMFLKAATKKYTNTRFRRAALFYLFSITREQLCAFPEYSLVLAANRTGCDYLSSIRKSCGIALLTKPADYRQRLSESCLQQYRCAMEADRLYTLLTQVPLPSDYYLRCSPYILKY